MLIIKYRYFREGPSLATTDVEDLVVRYQQGTRVKRTSSIPGVGRFNEIEGTKKPIKSRVTVSFSKAQDEVGRTGNHNGRADDE